MEVAIATLFNIRLNIIVPNISYGFRGMHECDLFIINKNGLASEVEIKRSKSDLLADFKKYHHHIDRQNRITYFYYAMPDDLYEKTKELIPEGAGVIICKRNKYNDYVNAIKLIKPKKIKNSRKLTTEEKLRVAELGTLRIWSLKQKIIKNGLHKAQRKNTDE